MDPGWPSVLAMIPSVGGRIQAGWRRVMASPRWNLAAGAGCLVLAGVLFAALGALENAVDVPPGALEPVWFALFLGTVPLLTVAGMVFLFQPARIGPGRAWAWGLGTYLAIGIVTAVTGIPGYLDGGLDGPADLLIVYAWPHFWLWLHECALGVGLWPCPPG